jgi:hypothetical protein
MTIRAWSLEYVSTIRPATVRRKLLLPVSMSPSSRKCVSSARLRKTGLRSLSAMPTANPVSAELKPFRSSYGTSVGSKRSADAG